MTRYGYPADDIQTAQWSAAAPTAVGESEAWAALGYSSSGVGLVSDTFTDTNGTALTAHTPDSAPVLSVTIDIDTATAGTFDLTVQALTAPAETLSAVDWDVTAAELETLLETLTFISDGDVTVSGGPGGTADITITWTTTGNLAADMAPTVTTDGGSLTGSSATVTENTAGWSLSGAWTVESNTAQILAATADAAAVISAAHPDVTVSLAVTWGIGANDADEHVGLIVRGNSVSDYLRLVPRKASGTKTFRLEQDDGTLLATFPVSPVAVTDTGTATLTAVCVGPDLTFRIDGETIGTYTLENDLATTYEEATFFGLYSNEQDATPDADFDTFTIERAANVSRSEVQTIEIDATGGTYTITVGGQTTAAIAYNATATTVQTALEALSTVAAGDIVVTGGPGATDKLYLTWAAAGDQTQVTTDATSLTGGAGTATVATNVAGIDRDNSYLTFTQAGITRYYAFRPARPTDADDLIDDVSLLVRSSRTGAGYIRAFIGVVNSQGNTRFAATSLIGTSVPTTGVETDQTIEVGGANSGGFAWDRYETDRYMFVKLISATTGAGAFGEVRVPLVRLGQAWSDQPTVTLDTVDTSAGNPLVSWTYDHQFSDGEQDAFQVMVWDPADITANPDTPLEQVDAAYDSGQVPSVDARNHRVAATLTAGFTYTFGVRAWAPDVVGRDLVSDWDTASGTTAAATDTTAGISAVASGDTVTVTASDPGPATRAVIERSVDGGTTWATISTAETVTGATTEAIDSFDRANGGLGNEEGPDTLAWSVEVGTTGAIVSNQAELDGSGHATVDVGNADVRVSAVVDLTGPASGVVARRSAADGYVLAKIDATTVDLIIWDEVAGSEHTAITPVEHGITADTATVELVCSGDEYLVNVNGRTLHRLIDATVDADIKAATEVGISGAGATGVHVFDDFAAYALDGTIVYVDEGAPQASDIRYRVTFYQVSTTGEFYRSATASSTAVSVTDTAWRLTSRTTGDTVTIVPETLDVTFVRPDTETRYVSGAAQVFGNNLAPRRWDITHRTQNAADYAAIEAIVEDTGRLTLADIFGNSWTVRFVGNVQEQQVLAQPQAGETTAVGHHHLWSFSLQALED